MKYSLGIFDFLDEISRLSHSIIFLYFFALFTKESFFTSPSYSLKLCIQMSLSFLSPLPFASFLFTAVCKATSENHFFHFGFLFLGDGLDHCLLCNVTNLCPQFFRHSIRSNLLNLFVTSTVWRADSFQKTPMLGKIGGRRRRGWQRMRWLDRITDLMDVSLGKFWELVMGREVGCAVVPRVAKNQTWLSNWIELNWTVYNHRNLI